MNPIFNAVTKRNIDSFLSNPSHGLMIEGESGAGKATVANFLAAKLLEIDSAKLADYPYFKKILPIKNTISIEEVRLSKQFFGLRTLGKKSIRRVLIVEDAGRMTTEAQNALLKLLEEPPVDTVIIFTVNPEQQLLPTINSRMQHVTILPPAKEDIDRFFRLQFSLSEIQKAYLISGGQVGLMASILAADTTHSLVSAISMAKEIIGQSKFERLARVDKLSKEKDQLPNLLLAMERLFNVALRQTTTSIDKTKTIMQALSKVLSAREALKHNPNMRMLLTDLFLSI